MKKNTSALVIPTFAEYNNNTPKQPTPEQQVLIDEYLESFTPKICCLESCWSQAMTDPPGVKPFIKAIPWMIEKEIGYAYRIISSGHDLEYYVKYPTGIIWNDPHLAGIDVFYLAAHGKPRGLMTSVKDIESEGLIKAWNGLERYFNIVYFSGCEVLGGAKGQEFVQEFRIKRLQEIHKKFGFTTQEELQPSS